MESSAVLFYLEYVETKEITVKLLKIIKHTFRGTAKILSKILRLCLPCNINNFDGNRNGES